MARSIGSIEISVDLDTKRLMATAVSSGEKVGKATKKEIEKELRKVEASIATIDGRKEAELLRKQIEHAVRDIEATLDFTEARLALEQFEENAEAVRLVLDVGAELSEQDIEEIRVDFKGFKERIEADKIRAQLELDAEGVYDDAATVQAALENLSITWEADLTGLDDAVAKANAAKFAIEKRRINLKFDAAKSLAEEMLKVEAAKEAIERDEVRWNIDFATALGKGEAEIKLFLAKEHNIKLGMDADVAAAAAQLEVDLLAIERTLPNIDAEIDMRLNEIDLAVQIAKINAMAAAGIRDFDINVEVAVDKASKAAADALVEKNFKELGTKSGKGFGGNLISGDNTKLILAAVLTMGDALAEGMVGALSAATAVASSAIYAVGSAAAAATPLIVGLGGARGAVVIGSQGVGDAMSAISEEIATAHAEGREADLAFGEVGEALRNLAPAAADTALAFGGVRDGLTDLRLDVQQELFGGMADVVRDLGKTALPSIAKGFKLSADSVNTFGKEMGKLASKTDFEGIFKALDPALDDALDGIKAVFGSIEPFLKKAAPAAERLAEMIERGAEGWEDWVKADTDKLDKFLDRGLDSLEQWAKLLASTGDLLGTIFAAGAESGDTFVTSLNNIIERWDAWLEGAEGQDALVSFFETGEDAMSALEPLLDGLKEAFDTLIDGDAMSNFEALSSAIGDMLPEVAEMIAVLGDLQLVDALTPIVDILGLMAEAIGLLPDGALELVGVLIILAKTASAVSGAVRSAEQGIKAMNTASVGMSRANLILTGLSIAVVAVSAAFNAFGDDAEEAEERTRDLTDALRDNIDATILSGDVAVGASFGIDTLNETLLATEGSGEKIKAAFKGINDGAGSMILTVDDTSRVLGQLHEGGESAVGMLTELAKGWGLSEGPAKELAKIVDETGGGFSKTEIIGTDLGAMLDALAVKTGKPKEELADLGQALTDLQSEGEKTDLAGAAEGLLDIEIMGTAAEKAILAETEAAVASGEVHNDALSIFDEYTRRLNAEQNASDDATTALDRQRGSQALVNDSIQAAIVAAHDLEVARKEASDKAWDAYQAEVKLAGATEDGAVQAAAALGFNEDLAQAFVDVGNAADEAKGKADAFASVMEKLLGPTIAVEDAAIALEQSIDDMAEALTGGSEATSLREQSEKELADAMKDTAEAAALRAAGDDAGAKAAEESAAAHRLNADEAVNEANALAEAAKTMDITTQAGRDNRAMLHDHAAALLEDASALLSQGVATGDINAQMILGREILTQNADAFGMTREEAELYATTLLGTPDLLRTVIEVPGLLDALLNAEDLTVLFDKVSGEPVTAQFQEMGLDEGLAQSSEFKQLLIDIGAIEATPVIDASGAVIPQEQVDALNTGFEALDQVESSPDIVEPPPTAQDAVTTLTTDLTTLDGMNVTPTITIPNLATTITKVETLDRLIRNLPNAAVAASQGNVSLPRGTWPGSMAGEMINSPTFRRVGERGYREAIVPLDLPLNRVDPSVRQLAALLRGEGSEVRLSGGKTINLTQHITPVTADPEAVATKVINRAAALVGT
jgi:hypothetical protein